MIIKLSRVKKALEMQKAMLFLLYKETLLLSNDLNNKLSNVIAFFSKDFEDIFPEEPRGLPPLTGIEHQIDLIPRTPILNQLAYKSNLEETKEIQRQSGIPIQKGLCEGKFKFLCRVYYLGA